MPIVATCSKYIGEVVLPFCGDVTDVCYQKSASSPAKQGRKKKPFSYEIAVDVTTTVTEAISRLALQTIKVLDDLRVSITVNTRSI